MEKNGSYRDTLSELGEVIYDHYGVYKTLTSGNISDQDTTRVILQDNAIGDNDSDNFIVDMGLSGGCKYIWIKYFSRESADSVAVGRSHTVYAPCTLRNLHNFKVLLRFPFADKQESRSVVSGEIRITDPERKIRIEQQIVQKLQEHTVRRVNKELLTSIICYILKKKSVGFKNFLYITVPDEEIQYQEYCLSIIETILRVIPVGLRKQLRFATNASKTSEENYHVLFARQSMVNYPEKSVSFTQDTVPTFLKKHGLNAELAELIRKCVTAPYQIDDCMQQMEVKMGSVEKLRDSDYIHYLEIVKLKAKPLTPELLQDYNTKLEQELAPIQRSMLEKQIDELLNNAACIENVFRQDDSNSGIISFEIWFAYLEKYKSLIAYLRDKGIVLTREYFEENFYQIKAQFFPAQYDLEDLKSIHDEEDREKRWLSQLKEQNENVIIYFDSAYLESHIQECSEQIKKLSEDYKRLQIQQWKQEIEKNFSLQNIQDICGKVKDSYTEEFNNFCQDIMNNIQRCRNQQIPIDAYITKLRTLNPKLKVQKELYEDYKLELQNIIENDPSGKKVEDAIRKIGNYFGKTFEQEFVCQTMQRLDRLFISALKGETTSLSKKSYEDIKSLLLSLYQQICIQSALKDKVYEVGNSYIAAQIVKDFQGALQNPRVQVTTINEIFLELDKYVDRDLEAYSTYKKQMQNLMSQHIKVLIEKDSEDDWPTHNGTIVENLYMALENQGEIPFELKKSYQGWRDKKGRLERKKLIQEKTDSFESYFDVRKNEKDLINNKDICEFRNRISEKKSTYSAGAFISAIEYIEKKSMDNILNISEEKIFYSEELRTFEKKKRLPVLLGKNMTLPEIYRQVNYYGELSDKTSVVFGKSDRGKIKTFDTNMIPSRVLNNIHAMIELSSKGVVTDRRPQAFFQNLESRDIKLWKCFKEVGLLNNITVSYINKIPDAKNSEEFQKLKGLFKGKNKKEFKKKLWFALGGVIMLVFVTIFVHNCNSSSPLDGAVVSESESKGSSDAMNKEKTEGLENNSSIKEDIREGENTSNEDTNEIDNEISDGNSAIEGQNIESMEPADPAIKTYSGNIAIDESKVRKARISGSDVIRIREEPGTSSDIVARVREKDNVIVEVDDSAEPIQENGLNWDHIIFIQKYTDSDGKEIPEKTEGYIASKYLDYDMDIEN